MKTLNLQKDKETIKIKQLQLNNTEHVKQHNWQMKWYYYKE